ncbi:MAG TPA: hypothetical protein ENK70_00630 [Methylophaga sp.]|nr:hypothetical protein [Methylophaga sp.]
MGISTTCKLGINANETKTVADFKLGDTTFDDQGGQMLYIQATADITAATRVTITKPAFTAANDAGTTGKYFSNVAIPTSEFGWVTRPVDVV